MTVWAKTKQRLNTFWQRQFVEAETSRQRAFDLLFGVIAPILCLIFDPAVFRGSTMGRAYLGPIQIFAYLSISLGIVILSTRLFVPIRSDLLTGALGGVLLLGGFLAFALGIILLPVTILAVLIARFEGIFGLIPFLTAFVFARNGVRAMREIRPLDNKAALAAVILLSIVLVLGFPVVLQWRATTFVKQSIQTLTYGDDQESKLAIARLKNAFWCTDMLCYDEIVWAYHDWYRSQGETAFWLADAYEEITGNDLEDRLWITGQIRIFR